MLTTTVSLNIKKMVKHQNVVRMDKRGIRMAINQLTRNTRRQKRIAHASTAKNERYATDIEK